MTILTRLQKFYRRQQRHRQELLVLELGEAGAALSLWQENTLQWQEQLTLGGTPELYSQELLESEPELYGQEKQPLDSEQESYWHMLREQVNRLLLAKETEEGIALAVVVAPTYLHTEQLQLPPLPKNELQQALGWEAEQCVPWAKGSYTWTYSLMPGEQQELLLYALPKAVLQSLQELAVYWQLRLVSVTTACSPQELQSLWYQGTGPQAELLASGWQQACSRGLSLSGRYVLQGAGCVVLLAVLAYGGAWGGHYLAYSRLQEARQQLALQEQWQLRYEESLRREGELHRLTKELGSAGKEAVLLSRELEQLGRLITPGCWLLAVEQKQKGAQLALQGQATDMTAVQGFVNNLQSKGNYSSVTVQKSRSNGQAVTYTLQLQLANTQQDKEEQP